jgi:P4 family phage/plasmid primase-like protien
MSSSKKFDNYLNKLYCEKGQTFTHTKIADKSLNIKGGCFHISEEEENNFYKKYYEHVFKNGNSEYLTEKQFLDGTLAIDFDLRYNSSIDKRIHKQEHIEDMIKLYADKLNYILTITPDSLIDVFIFEKKNVNKLEDVTKDGIHMIIGINIERTLNIILRDLIIDDLPKIWGDLPIINSWEDVLDEGITKGGTNWQMYGSKKPNHESYILTHYYKIEFGNKEDKLIPQNISSFDFENNFTKLLIRYKNHPTFTMNTEIQSLYEAKKKKKTNSGGKSMKIVKKGAIRLSEITNSNILDEAIENIMENIDTNDYHVKETHDFTMCLGKDYYEPYNNWIRVCFALRNTDSRLFLTWVKFSSKSSKFSFDKIGEMYDMWQRKNYDYDNNEILTKRSIMYWAKQDNPKEFQRVKDESIETFIEKAVETPTEVDCANILYHLKKEKYVCSSVKNNTWHEFKDHRWCELDQGVSLRNVISTELHNLVMNKSSSAMKMIQSVEQGSEDWKIWKKKASRFSDLCNKLKTTCFKNNIMRESMELFYDGVFIDKIDSNPNLLCFNNGVVDFISKTFRKGNPDDYCMKCTEIDYIKFDENLYKKELEIINRFMQTVFPIKELEDYMWSHLASSLIGVNKDHSFHIYTGSGSNGKSMLTDFMSMCLGKYKAQVPLQLITQKRNSIGSSSSEVANLQGVRYAVMQEPSKGERLNEGVMKEITGGDPITARHLFKNAFTFKPMFKLVVASNHLFEIKSNDDGTWRRIRICDFKSKFKKDAKENDAENPYQFEIDYNLTDKLKKVAPIFMSMLVERCYKDEGVVLPCAIVEAKSKDYRNDQDYLAEFVTEKIISQPSGKIKKTELYETFKQWYNEQYGKNVPKGKELYSFMDKRFGKYSTCWKNVEIRYDEYENTDFIEGT